MCCVENLTVDFSAPFAQCRPLWFLKALLKEMDSFHSLLDLDSIYSRHTDLRLTVWSVKDLAKILCFRLKDILKCRVYGLFDFLGQCWFLLGLFRFFYDPCLVSWATRDILGVIILDNFSLLYAHSVTKKFVPRYQVLYVCIFALFLFLSLWSVRTWVPKPKSSTYSARFVAYYSSNHSLELLSTALKW